MSREMSFFVFAIKVVWKQAYLLGASIRIGAVIPRYNLEALADVNPSCS